jgi:hypothetical protein
MQDQSTGYERAYIRDVGVMCDKHSFIALGYTRKQGMSTEEVEMEKRMKAYITSDGSLLGDYVR